MNCDRLPDYQTKRRGRSRLNLRAATAMPRSHRGGGFLSQARGDCDRPGSFALILLKS
jgi:hypothetical protein